jgi:peptidoglycan/LPS O-acetylase OafA/YrhL
MSSQHSSDTVRLEDLSKIGSSTPIRKSGHLNNLNALRFFAASAVIISHVELEKGIAHLPNALNSPFVRCAGTEAVKFFFVLSGFLITYLLLKEREKTSTVSIKSFYVRRILRIWPLYYATVLIAFLLVPHLHFITARDGIAELSKHYWQSFGLFLVFLPNLARIVYESVPAAMQCWSLGVEEQFYLLWPLLMKVCGKTPLRVLFGVIFAKSLLLKVFAGHEPLVIPHYLRMFCIEAMVAGGIAAYYFLYASQPGQLKARVAVSICATASCIVWLICGHDPAEIGWLLGYSILITVAAQLPKIGGPLYAPLEYLGNISYGIYMLHPLAVLIVVNLLSRWHAFGNCQSLAAYVSTFALAIGFAAISYRFMEAPILKLKHKFEPERKVQNVKAEQARVVVLQ